MLYGLVLVVFTLFIFGCAKNLKQTGSAANESLLQMAKGFSDNNQSVIDEVQSFLSNKDHYFKVHEGQLVERGIYDPSEITRPVVLIDALVKINKLVYQDGSAEPNDTLSLLNELSDNTLSNNECFQNLVSYYSNTKYGIGNYLGQKGDWPSIFECIQKSGFVLLAINEDSDALPLVLIKLKDLQTVINLAKEANINLWFTNQ